MPVVMFFFYMLSEILAFWAVASLIGFGWAMLALLATVVLGILITRIEVLPLRSLACCWYSR